MSLTFERKLPIILFFVFLMLTIIGFVLYQNTMSLQDAINWEKRTTEITQNLDETVTLSLDIQSGMINFFLMGNNTYLNPFNRAKPRITRNISRLRQLTAGDPAQTEAIDQIEQLLKKYVDEAGKKVDIRRSQGRDAMVDELPWSEGEGMIDRIRASAERIKSVENESLQKREQSLDRNLSWTIWILIGSSIAGIISLGLANLIVLSEIKKRRIAQVALVEANNGLEKRIGRRTAQLSEANEKLKEIATEREGILLNEKGARKEAEIANRLRDEFMATVSHELRTPLNSILGWARLMKGGTLDEQQSKKALSTIIKNSETQNRLIEDLLDVARVISGKLQLEIIEINPVEIISNAIETVRPIAEAKQIKINLNVQEPDRAHLINGDRNRMMQIFTNLLTNAIKFSPDAASIFVSMDFSDGTVTTKIKDSGKGISAEFLPMVFERFRQDTSGASKNGGLGLGLAIVRNLVEIHGGFVRAESAGEDKGSTFTVILPLADTALTSEHLLNNVEKINGNNVG